MGTLTSPNGTLSLVTVVFFNTEARDNVTGPVWTLPHAFQTIERRLTARPRDLRRAIENFRANPRGESAWQRAEESKREARREAMILGRMNRVKYFRIERKMTQEEVALAIGSKQSDISRYERMGYKPKLQTLERLAAVLGVSVADLL